MGGCAALVAHGYCPEHRPTEYRGTAASRGYDHAWTKTRAAFLARYPLCGMRPDGRVSVGSRCHAAGLVTPATHVDHVIPHRGDRSRFLDVQGNCQALCASCHNAKSQIERQS